MEKKVRVRFKRGGPLKSFARQNYWFITDGDIQLIPIEDTERLIKEFPDNFEILGHEKKTPEEKNTNSKLEEWLPMGW